MSGNKLVIIVLILIALLFIVFVVWGSASKEDQRDDKTRAAEFSEGDHGGIEWAKKQMAKLLGKAMKEVKLSCANPPSPNSELRCDGLAIDTDISVPAEKDSSFRTVTFIRKKGVPVISYRDATSPDAEDKKLDEQDCDWREDKIRNKRSCSIVALKRGGSFRITCDGENPCEVGLE